MSVYTELDLVQIRLGELQSDFTVPMTDNTGQEIFFKTPKMIFRGERDSDLLLEFGLSSDEFYKQIKKIEDRVKTLIIDSDIVPFKEKALNDLHSSYIRLPDSVKSCPVLSVRKGGGMLFYDKNNDPTEKRPEDGVQVVLMLQLNRVSFEKTRWCIDISAAAVKLIEETAQLSDYMFRDSEEIDTNVILETECY